MQPLRITEAPDLTLHPEDLFHSMERTCLSLDDLLKNLNVSFDNLQETLAAPETSNLLDAKQKVAALQVQLIALRAAPMAMVRLIQLSNESEKPEAAHRAASSILHISGIATNTSSQEPAPPPVPKITPEEEDPRMDTPHARQLLSSMAFCMELQRALHVTFDQIPHEKKDAIIQALRPFFPEPPRPPFTNPASK